MLIPQLHIIQRQSPSDVIKEFNDWALRRARMVKSLDIEDKEDTLGIPSETHLQWDQGLQHYVLTVAYLASEEEVEHTGGKAL